MNIYQNFMAHLPDWTTVQQYQVTKIDAIKAYLRKKTSLFLLNTLSLTKQTIDQEEIENYFYTTTDIRLADLKQWECRRKNEQVVGLRLVHPSGHQKYFEWKEAILLREAIALYEPQAVIEEK